MLLGPVFAVEILTTARRGRYYAIRFVYGALLLTLIAVRYHDTGIASSATATPTPQAMASFASSLFVALNAAQAAAVLFLTPALVAGTIAEERQRKTLHYLLASELSGWEIVLGKLAARLLHALVFLAVGLPVLGLIGLFGGIDPKEVALSIGGAASTAFFVAGIAILASAVSPRACEAVALAYLLEVGWLFLPTVIEWFLAGWPGAVARYGPVHAWLMATNPVALVALGEWFTPADLGRLGWMMGLQWLGGSALVALAVGRLRPSDRAVGVGVGRKRLGGEGRRRWIARPIGDDPMLWKECRVDRAGGLFRVAWTGLGLLGLASLGFLVAMASWAAFEELAREGYGQGIGSNQARRGDLKTLIVTATGFVSFVWMVAVAGSAAGVLTTEREEDTWISLVGTTLEGREILRAKRIGAFLRPRVLLATLAALWTVGVAAGALHPLALVALAVEVVAIGGFAAALGTFFSLRARTTARALGETFGLLLVIDLCVSFFGLREGLKHMFSYSLTSTVLFAFCPPVLFSYTCVDYVTVRKTLGWGVANFDPWTSTYVTDALAGLGATITYAGAGWLLAWATNRQFDRVAGRPRRSVRAVPVASA